MARYTGPRERIERRLGEPLGLKGERAHSPKAALVKRPYPPGQHGPTHRPRKLSEFGAQLKSKQKVRNTYRLLEKSFRSYVKRALADHRISPYEGVVRGLETRLDNVVFRSGLAQSRDQARQTVSHGHITLNGKRAKTPSIVVKVGDTIGVREQSKASPYFATMIPQWLEKAAIPAWLEMDKRGLTSVVKTVPVVEESGIQSGDLQAIIEYYSR